MKRPRPALTEAWLVEFERRVRDVVAALEDKKAHEQQPSENRESDEQPG